MSRARWRARRRLRFHRVGWAFSLGAVGIGVSAIGTGNNLLFLVLGAMLGFITLSGALSEQTLRGVRVRRHLPRALTAGRPARIGYRLENSKRRLPSFALEVGEKASERRGFVFSIEPGGESFVRVEHLWPRRGVYPLTEMVLSTSFPFGLFRKERDLDSAEDEVIVWPSTERAVREARPTGAEARRSGAAPAGAAGARGEYRGLRPYRAGDDPRDVHWRSSARYGEPVVREYERDQARSLWLALDLRAPRGSEETAERAVEIAAALAARAAGRGENFGLLSADARVEPGTGPAQLERVLDLLARARFRPDAPPPPVPPRDGVLVTVNAAAGAGWGDVFVAGREAG